MSGRRQNDNRGNSAILSTIAAVGIGAIAAAGAFFVGKAIGEEETEARLKAQQHYQQQRQQQLQSRVATEVRVQQLEDTEEFTEDEDEDPKRVGGLERECVICMSEFEELKRGDVEIHTTPCGHLFCAGCISRCLQRRHECPTCKQVVEPGQTLRIFL